MAKQEFVVEDSQLVRWQEALRAHSFSPLDINYMEMESVVAELIASRKIHRAALKLTAKWGRRELDLPPDIYEAINEVCESVDTVPRFPIL